MPDLHLNILVIEDEPAFSKLVVAMLSGLEGFSFNAKMAGRLDEGLAALAEDKTIDVVLLDLDLPDSGGLDTLVRVHASAPWAPVVVVTGIGDQELSLEALRQGAQDYLEKVQIQPNLLFRVMSYAIERKQMETRLSAHQTELERLVEEQIIQLRQANRALRALSDVNEAVIKATDEIELMEQVCRIAVSRACYRLAWVGLTEHDEEKTVRPVASYGFDEGYLESMRVTWADTPRGRGPTGRAIRNGQPQVARDLLTDPDYEPWREVAQRHGFASSIALPLISGGASLGALNIYSRYPDSFDQEETDLLRELAQSLALGIFTLRTRQDRRNAEQALRASEARIRALFDLLPDPVVVYDMEGRVLIVNSAFEKTFGWSRRDLLEKKISFVPAEALPDTIVNLERIKKGESVRDFETKRLTEDGRTLDVLLNTAPYFEEGKQSGNVVVLHDMTEKKAAYRALRESEARFRDLVEAIPEGIITVTADQIITYVNHPYASMIGYTPEEMMGKNVDAFFDKEGLKNFQRQWVLRQQGVREPYESSMATRDGGRVFVMIYPTPLFNVYGHFRGVTALVTDITQRKILESQLLQAQKLEAIGQLAAGIAHEINTPTQYVTDNTRFLQQALGGILALLGKYAHLTKELKKQGQYGELLSDIDENIGDMDLDYLLEEMPISFEQTLQGLERIATIVRSMKEFAHPGPTSKVPTDINKAILNTIIVAKNEWKYVADVETDLDPELTQVPCIPGEINQVILNLLVNAAHAIGDATKGGEERKGLIRISTKREEGWAVVRISDDGTGIPDAIRDRIFDPFFTTKDPGKGTGQGLAIAYTAVAKNHQGTIIVNSEVGKGTTFTIRLPLDAPGGEAS